jgi:carbonic anhydrase/acetyltransferase-like protein (isoleucine patch superfamily)
VFIAPGAVVIGRTTLAAGVSVWFNTVLRADHSTIDIGAETNLQDSCVMHADPNHPATVGAHVSIAHSVTLHGCTVGDGCLIGMGATVMNGAVIGAGSLVAAGSLVTEGKQFPPGVLIAGSPATVRRELAPEHSAGLRRNAAFYHQLARQYMSS